MLLTSKYVDVLLFRALDLCILFLQGVVMTFLTSSGEEGLLKDVASLLSVIGCLYKMLPPGGEEYQQVYDWVHRLCVDQEIGES